jgi:hypothetical protein
MVITSRKERIILWEQEREEKRKWRALCGQAGKELHNEGKIGFCGTAAELRKRGKIEKRAQEIGAREQYEKLKRKFG